MIESERKINQESIESAYQEREKKTLKWKNIFFYICKLYAKCLEDLLPFFYEYCVYVCVIKYK